jgi:integrase
MPTIRFTQLGVERLKPPASGRVEYWDATCPGFGLRVSAPAGSRAGRKTWMAFYRVNGKLVRETIGTLATFPNVADARKRVQESLQKAADGINPVAERRHQAIEQTSVLQAAVPTVRQVVARYLIEYAKDHMRPDYYKESERALRVDVVALIGGMPIDQVTKLMIRSKVIAPIVARGRKPHASHVLRYIRAFLRWAVHEDIIPANPAIDIPDPDPRKKEHRERDRYLAPGVRDPEHPDAAVADEISPFWEACNLIGQPFGPLFQLLLLTGARRDELAQAVWSEFDLKRQLWVLPRHRSKNDKEHRCHLSAPAIAILESLPRRSAFLFSTNDHTPVSGFGRARERLLKEMRGLAGTEIAHFIIHDLRRTIATGMAELGVSEHVVDRVLNHSGRKVSGVARIYNRSEYLPERQAALELWARHIEGLVRPSPEAPTNVVEFASVAHRSAQ